MMPPRVYYNDNDPAMVAWLRVLVAQGLLPDGEIDSRSIVDVRPDDVRDFDRCHFFAGIGGWEVALQLASWPDDRRIWTGSCPCQPFSSAGSKTGANDSRDLWAEWFRIIRVCRPDCIAGEQVAGATEYGWIDLVFDDLEGEGYACGSAALPAACVGAAHRRQRIWFLGVAAGSGREWQRDSAAYAKPLQTSQAAAATAAWSSVTWMRCVDGKRRPTESGFFPLADGLPARVASLRGYGNAIVPQVAAEFIAAYLDIR